MKELKRKFDKRLINNAKCITGGCFQWLNNAELNVCAENATEKQPPNRYVAL